MLAIRDELNVELIEVQPVGLAGFWNGTQNLQRLEPHTFTLNFNMQSTSSLLETR